MPPPSTSCAYFTELELCNVRSFGDRQELDLSDEKGRPAQWTLIVGDNGVGKTTLLQCLALMRPVIAARSAKLKSEPDRVEPALLQRENAELIDLARVGKSDVELVAKLTSEALVGGSRPGRDEYSLKAQIQVKDGELIDVHRTVQKMASPFEPLVIAYGAARHLRYGRPAIETPLPDPTDSIFNPSVELVNPVEILEGLDYSAVKGQPGAKHLLKRIKAALVEILPGVENIDQIKLYGPASPGSTTRKRGVQVVTAFGEVPMTSLSLGYQTMTAWIIDLAWRLYQKYPKSPNALKEPAIVLIDELDLHLHPKWQRGLRESVVETFQIFSS
jgi:energy-coupling factor transporter ATP-binding protein EcfA2